MEIQMYMEISGGCYLVLLHKLHTGQYYSTYLKSLDTARLYPLNIPWMSYFESMVKFYAMRIAIKKGVTLNVIQ